MYGQILPSVRPPYRTTSTDTADVAGVTAGSGVNNDAVAAIYTMCNSHHCRNAATDEKLNAEIYNSDTVTTSRKIHPRDGRGRPSNLVEGEGGHGGLLRTVRLCRWVCACALVQFSGDL
jgi:hypothetical protein